MSDNPLFNNNSFGKFVPGFDFLQNLATSAVKGAAGSIPQLPNPANWIAPTLNLEELEKRIDELKTVQFWLDQNAKALAATVTALEVQKMTLATLKGMNFNMGDVANAFKLKAADTMIGSVKSMTEKVTDTLGGVPSAGNGRKKPAAKSSRASAGKASSASSAASPAAPGMIDPMQLWGSLTQQFQQIAGNAMKDVAQKTAIDTTKNMAKAMTKSAMNSAMNTAGAMAKSAGQVARKSIANSVMKSPAKTRKR